MPDVNGNAWGLCEPRSDQFAVRFKTADKGSMRLIYPDALLRLPVADLKKLVFPAMCYWEYQEEQNRNAIYLTHKEIKSQLYRLQAEWDMTSITYQREYSLEKGKKTANDKLLNTVKRSKRAFERMTKVRGAFFETLEKFNLRDYLEEAQL